MDVIAPGVQVADRHRIDLCPHEGAHRTAQRVLVEWSRDTAVGADSLSHPEPQVTRHQWLGPGEAQIVALRLQAFAHFQHVPMSRARQQTHPGAPAFKQCVGGDCHPVHDALGARQQIAEIVVQALGQSHERVHDPKRLVGGRARGLDESHRALAVHRDDIGEGAADVDTDTEPGLDSFPFVIGFHSVISSCRDRTSLAELR